METVEIQIEPREVGSKRKARQLRRAGKLPGVFYGPKVDPVPLAMPKKAFLDSIGRLQGSRLVRIKSASPSLADKVALVKEIQLHPVTGDVLHADFYEVDLSAKIQVEVPLRFVGRAVGVIQGGILQPIVREVEVECLPTDIPEVLSVDVSSLEIGQSLHVTDIPLPEGVVALYETRFTVVTVATPTVEEAPAVEAAEATEAVQVGVEGVEAPAAAAGEKQKREGS